METFISRDGKIKVKRYDVLGTRTVDKKFLLEYKNRIRVGYPGFGGKPIKPNDNCPILKANEGQPKLTVPGVRYAVSEKSSGEFIPFVGAKLRDDLAFSHDVKLTENFLTLVGCGLDQACQDCPLNPSPKLREIEQQFAAVGK